MTTEDPPDGVRLRQTIAASRDDVFDAFTEPEQIREWWGPGAFTCPRAEIDLRTGGRYRLEMRSPEGHEMAVVGTYEVVERPHRLVFTWRWEGIPDGEPESLVSVEFRDADGDTEVVVTHGRFPAGHETADYRNGWTSGLEKLERFLTEGASQA